MAAPKAPNFPKASFPPLSDTKKETFENKAIEAWLSEATQSQNTTNMLKNFGLNNASDVLAQLRSPAGKTIRALFNKQREILEAQKNNAKANQRAEKEMTALLLGLAYEEEAAEEAAEERVIQYNNQLMETQLEAGEKRIDAQEERALNQYLNATREAAAYYNDSIDALELALKEQHATYDALENELHDLEHTEVELEKRAGIVDTLLADIGGFFDLDSEEQDRLTHNDRELTHRFSKDKIIAKEEGKSFVLQRGQKLDQLSSQEKTDAHQAYIKLKPSLDALQDKIKTSHQADINQHNTKKAQFAHKSGQVHQDTLFITQQLTQLHSAKHLVQNELESHRLKPQLKPSSQKNDETKANDKPHVTAQQQKRANAPQNKPQPAPTIEPQANTAILTRSFKMMLQINPQATLASMDRLGAPDFLKQVNIGHTSNTELETMKSLQRHRAGKAGAIANDLQTNPQALAAQRNDDQLTPEPNSPRAQAKAVLKAELQANSKPTPKPKPTPENEPQPEPKPNNTPSPFSTKPTPQ